MECLLYVSPVTSHELSCFLHTSGLEHKIRARASTVFFTLLSICVCFGQSVNKYGVNSRSLAVFLFYLHLFVLGIIKETQQDKSELKRS